MVIGGDRRPPRCCGLRHPLTRLGNRANSSTELRVKPLPVAQQLAPASECLNGGSSVHSQLHRDDASDAPELDREDRAAIIGRPCAGREGQGRGLCHAVAASTPPDGGSVMAGATPRPAPAPVVGCAAVFRCVGCRGGLPVPLGLPFAAALSGHDGDIFPPGIVVAEGLV